MSYSIGISDFKAPFLQIIAEVDYRTADEKSTLGINHDAHLVGFNQDIAICRPVDEIHFVLQPGTSTPDYCYSERARRPALAGQKLR